MIQTFSVFFSFLSDKQPGLQRHQILACSSRSLHFTRLFSAWIRAKHSPVHSTFSGRHCLSHCIVPCSIVLKRALRSCFMTTSDQLTLHYGGQHVFIDTLLHISSFVTRSLSKIPSRRLKSSIAAAQIHIQSSQLVRIHKNRQGENIRQSEFIFSGELFVFFDRFQSHCHGSCHSLFALTSQIISIC